MSREDVEVPAEAVLDSGGDFVDQTWDVVGEGAVDDDDVRVEGVENRVQADSDVVGEILHYFEGVGVAFLVILDRGRGWCGRIRRRSRSGRCRVRRQ